jgi:hypothetical protein
MLRTWFRTASRWRGARVFHPRGVGFHASWRPSPSGPLPAGSPLARGARPALLRLSHAAGFPPSTPDVLGWAIKILDVYGRGGDQDLLLASTGRGRVGRHLLRPARDVATATFSSLLPYRIPGLGQQTIVVTAALGTAAAPYETIVRQGADRVPAFEVRVGAPDGPRLATVEVGRSAAPAIVEAARYDPWHTGPDLEPVGWLNRLRRPTYAASQEGRGAIEDDDPT